MTGKSRATLNYRIRNKAIFALADAGWSHDDIAQALRLTPDTVQSRISRQKDADEWRQSPCGKLGLILPAKAGNVVNAAAPASLSELRAMLPEIGKMPHVGEQTLSAIQRELDRLGH